MYAPVSLIFIFRDIELILLFLRLRFSWFGFKFWSVKYYHKPDKIHNFDISSLMNNRNHSQDMRHKSGGNCLKWSNEKNIHSMEWNKEKNSHSYPLQTRRQATIKLPKLSNLVTSKLPKMSSPPPYLSWPPSNNPLIQRYIVWPLHPIAEQG